MRDSFPLLKVIKMPVMSNEMLDPYNETFETLYREIPSLELVLKPDNTPLWSWDKDKLIVRGTPSYEGKKSLIENITEEDIVYEIKPLLERNKRGKF